MKTVEKKIWPEHFKEIESGKKTFELRAADFEVHEGDTLILREWEPSTKTYTGRTIKKRVGHVGTWTLEDIKKYGDFEKHGMHVISILDEK